MGKVVPPEPNTWSRLRRNPVALISMVLLLIVALAAVIGPFFLPIEYERPSELQFSEPTRAHWFGTDLSGRDVLYRVLSGARISLLVGAAGAAISLVVGTTYGLIAGYAGGKTDALMMRIVDVLYSVPRLIIVLVFINAFDPILKGMMFDAGLIGLSAYSKVVILILCLGLIEWLTMARIVRGQVLAIKSQQFVLAAQSLGQSHHRIILRHLLPNLLGVVVVYLTLTIPAVILDESFLSFLGLGIDAPQASWGTLLSDGAQAINTVKSYWWLLVFPGTVMALTLLALNFLGDAIRDALDVR